jgi:hypothetical protein
MDVCDSEEKVTHHLFNDATLTAISLTIRVHWKIYRTVIDKSTLH